MNPPERRSIPLAGLSLISAGAVLGLALAVPSPASAADTRPARSDSATVVDEKSPDR